MYNSLKLWPAVTAFSFAFVRAEYRFMFSGVFAVCWQSYLSFLNRREEREERVGWNATRALREFGEGKIKEKLNVEAVSDAGLGEDGRKRVAAARAD
jgi:Mpv17 / PMP22 family